MINFSESAALPPADAPLLKKDAVPSLLKYRS